MTGSGLKTATRTEFEVRMVKALKCAREVVAAQLEAGTFSYAIGGWDGKSEPKFDAEGFQYIRPLRGALAEIDDALKLARGEP